MAASNTQAAMDVPPDCHPPVPQAIVAEVGRMPAHADAEVLAKRAELASAVRGDLAAAGLPLAPQDVGPEFAVGASVDVDPLDDESGGGVVVAWRAHWVLVAAAMDALSEGRGPDDPCIQLAGTAAKAMQDAIAEILSVAGYTVKKDSDDMQPFHLLVTERRVTASWRDRLAVQATRRDETLTATYRNPGSQDQGDAARRPERPEPPQSSEQVQLQRSTVGVDVGAAVPPACHIRRTGSVPRGQPRSTPRPADAAIAVTSARRGPDGRVGADVMVAAIAVGAVASSSVANVCDLARSPVHDTQRLRTSEAPVAAHVSLPLSHRGPRQAARAVRIAPRRPADLLGQLKLGQKIQIPVMTVMTDPWNHTRIAIERDRPRTPRRTASTTRSPAASRNGIATKAMALKKAAPRRTFERDTSAGRQGSPIGPDPLRPYSPCSSRSRARPSPGTASLG
jgi:hypothetical protein